MDFDEILFLKNKSEYERNMENNGKFSIPSKISGNVK